MSRVAGLNDYKTEGQNHDSDYSQLRPELSRKFFCSLTKLTERMNASRAQIFKSRWTHRAEGSCIPIPTIIDYFTLFVYLAYLIH